MYKQRWGLIAVVWLLWLPASCAAEEGNAPSTRAYLACKMSQGLFACDAYARNQGAVVYARPDVMSKVLEKVEYGRLISITEPASKVEKYEWIQTDTVLENPDPKAKRKTKTYAGYVRRTDMILDTDFRKVVACWPVKYALVAEEAAGDWEPHGVWFDTSGLARGPEGRDFGEQHTYYADGVFTVRHPKYTNLHLYGHGTIDYEKLIAKYMGTVVLRENESVPGVEWFSPNNLKGCKAIPTVDPDSRAPNPKESQEGR